MSAPAAGGMMMWMAGVGFGIGIMAPDYSLIFLGIFLSLVGGLYIRRFAEKDAE